MKVDILIIGVGGTGGCLFTKIARFLAGTEFENMSVSVRIMDGDFVETKNLGRQPFSDEDIGMNKAVALAAAAEETLGIRVTAYPAYLKPDNVNILKERLTEDYSDSNNIRIVVGAVDNHACRKILHDFFMKYRSSEKLFYIDTANEDYCGEVVIGKRTYGKIEAPDRAHYYPEILTDEGKAVYEMSCEELNQSRPQHLATNSMVADATFSYIAQLISAGKFAHEARGGIIYVDAGQIFMRFREYTEEVYGAIECR